MASIKLKHSGGNGVIIAAPTSNPSSDKTLTLPSTETGTIVSKDSANSLQNITGINGGQLGNRNLIINGAMQVAQRGTSSSTDTNGRHTIDRFQPTWSNINNAITQAQVDTSSGDLPFTKGLRKEFKITNGDNTPATNTQLKINYAIESQDLAGSGWDTVNSSSNVTLSFYVKSSVAQTFVVHLYADDSNKAYAFEYAATTSWTKITHTITGASGLSFNNDNGIGLIIQWYLYMGTDVTNNSFTNNTWGSYSSSSRSKDMTNTWYDTNDATFEITGVQLEVGSVATDFEHRSFGQELALCQRYYYVHVDGATSGSAHEAIGTGTWYNGSEFYTAIHFTTTMRTAPSLDQASGSNYYYQNNAGGGGAFNDFSAVWSASPNMAYLSKTGSSGTQGAAAMVRTGSTSAKLAFNAEL